VKFTILEENLASQERKHWFAFASPTLKGGITRGRVKPIGSNLPVRLRVEDNDVRIRSDLNCAFLGIQSKLTGRIRRKTVNHLSQRNPPFHNTLAMKQGKQGLDPRGAKRDFSKGAGSQLLLLAVESRMIRGHNPDQPLAQPLPQSLIVLYCSKRGGHLDQTSQTDGVRTGKKEILWTGLSPNPLA
jgi:hypothetical protein